MRIITRSEWGARHGRGNDVTSKLPWGEVVIHTEAGAIRKEDWPALQELAALDLSLAEEQKLRAVENFHVNTRGWNGIAYSFLIFPDGTVAEGRGWGRSGAHTEGRNSTACGVCFIGHGDLQPATEAQWAATRWLIGEGIRLGHLRPGPLITTHAKYSGKGKTCPGTLIAPHVTQRLGGITGPGPTGPTTPTGPSTKETFLMALTDTQQKRLLDLAEAGDMRHQAAEQRLARIEAALNTDGNDKGPDGRPKASYPVRILQGVQTLLDREPGE